MASSPKSSSATEQGRSPWLFFAMAGFIILAIILFLIIRPVGGNSGGGASTPAATKVK